MFSILTDFLKRVNIYSKDNKYFFKKLLNTTMNNKVKFIRNLKINVFLKKLKIYMY
jgi:hypothetical protein